MSVGTGEELGREGHILERVMYMGSGQPPLIEDMFDDDVRGIVSYPKGKGKDGFWDDYFLMW